MPRVPKVLSSNRGAPLGKRTHKTRKNLSSHVSKRKRKATSPTMMKRELPDVGTLTRLPLATSRASRHDEVASGTTDNSSSSDELMVVASSAGHLTRRPISVSSRSRTPSDQSIVDLTNDSGLEDEDIVDLTDTFQMPTFGSTVPVSSGGHSITSGASSSSRSTIAASEVVIVPESDDDVQFVSSSLVHIPSTEDSEPSEQASTPTTNSLSASSPSSSSSCAPNSISKSSISCPVCMDRASQFEQSGRKLVTTTCGHVFCDVCIKNAISALHKCPVCNKKLSLRQYHRLFIS